LDCTNRHATFGPHDDCEEEYEDRTPEHEQFGKLQKRPVDLVEVAVEFAVAGGSGSSSSSGSGDGSGSLDAQSIVLTLCSRLWDILWTVVVMLTDSPAGCEPSSVIVYGAGTHTYGCTAGSAAIFPSDCWHMTGHVNYEVKPMKKLTLLFGTRLPC
jgi:hypothetical protein